MQENFNRKKIIAQAATELAIFGAILLFLIGGLVRVGFQQSTSMNQNLSALRLALSESWRTSQGKYTSGEPGISRSSAAILIIEDRLSVDSGQKFGTRDRIPFMTQGTGTFTQNMFYSLDAWGQENVPVYDIFINGVRFPLSTARFVRYSFNTATLASLSTCQQPHPNDSRCDGGGFVVFHRRTYNYVNSTTYEASRAGRFDLGFDNVLDDRFKNEDFRENFFWQWVPVWGLRTVPPGQGVEALSDSGQPSIDIDGDFNEESVYGVTFDNDGKVASVDVLDSERGDIDMSYESTQATDRIGLQIEAQMYSFTQGNPKLGEGTYYRITEGQLQNLQGRFIRNTTRNDHVDLIMRQIKISNDTGRFCPAAPDPCPTTPDGACNWADTTVYQDSKTFCQYEGLCSLTNPVEVCSQGAGTTCFDQDKIERTCLDQDEKILFVRSRLKNIQGFKWITRTDQ